MIRTRCRFRFGLPFVLYMERTVTWDALQKEILEKMRHLLRPGVYIQVGRRTNTLILHTVSQTIGYYNVSLHYCEMSRRLFFLIKPPQLWCLCVGRTFQSPRGWRCRYHLPPSTRWATTVSPNRGKVSSVSYRCVYHIGVNYEWYVIKSFTHTHTHTIQLFGSFVSFVVILTSS